MVLDWLGKAKGAGVSDLIARRKHAKAIELLRAEIEAGGRSAQMRLQLADLLALAGREKEAVPILIGLGDEFAREGFAAKAIAVLKRVMRIQPDRADVDVELARLIKEQRASPPPPRAPSPALEIGMEVVTHVPAADEAASEEPTGSLGDDLLDVIESVLQAPVPASRSDGAAPIAPVQSPLFSDFSQDELVAVMRGLELLSFDPGDILMGEGEPGDSLFVLTSGVAKVFVKDPAGHPVLVREMEDGAFFGEISILTGGPRTATVTAKTRCELLELDRVTLDQITKTHARVRDVLTRFCQERLGTVPGAGRDG